MSGKLFIQIVALFVIFIVLIMGTKMVMKSACGGRKCPACAALQK